MFSASQEVKDAAETTLRALANAIVGVESEVSSTIWVGDIAGPDRLFCVLTLGKSSWDGEALEIVLTTMHDRRRGEWRLVLECDFSDGTGGPEFAFRVIPIADSEIGMERNALLAIAGLREELFSRVQEILAIIHSGPSVPN